MQTVRTQTHSKASENKGTPVVLSDRIHNAVRAKKVAVVVENVAASKYCVPKRNFEAGHGKRLRCIVRLDELWAVVKVFGFVALQNFAQHEVATALALAWQVKVRTIVIFHINTAPTLWVTNVAIDIP